MNRDEKARTHPQALVFLFASPQKSRPAAAMAACKDANAPTWSKHGGRSVEPVGCGAIRSSVMIRESYSKRARLAVNDGVQNARLRLQEALDATGACRIKICRVEIHNAYSEYSPILIVLRFRAHAVSVRLGSLVSLTSSGWSCAQDHGTPRSSVPFCSEHASGWSE